jgi:hypothetical protein
MVSGHRLVRETMSTARADQEAVTGSGTGTLSRCAASTISSQIFGGNGTPSRQGSS